MPTFALVDCNNFYASCERLFQPDLLDMRISGYAKQRFGGQSA